MSKELVISATPHETRVAIVEDGQLCEIYIEREKEFALVGSLYKGRVTRVLRGCSQPSWTSASIAMHFCTSAISWNILRTTTTSRLR